MHSFPSCRLPWDTQREWKRVEKKWGMAKLFLMNWDWCIWKLNYTIANAVPKNNNKILKRFKPNKFAKFWGKIYFQMSFTALFFFFFAWRELHNNKLNYYCEFPFWIKKKTFKITALQSCALTVGILQFCSRTTRKS